MNRRNDPHVTAPRSLIVGGELGPRYASVFDGVTLHARHGETESTGPIVHPSRLQGLLERIAGLGLTLHSVNPLDTENGETDAQTHTQPAGVDDDASGTNSKEP